MNTTVSLATWVTAVQAQEVPEEALRIARDAITDCIGVALAGSCSPQAQIARGLAAEGRLSREAVLWGTAERTTASWAALANGVAAHALDFDDTNHPLYGHPSCHLVPALIAMGERLGSSGQEVLVAYLIGFEVEVRIARAINMAHYLAGWHATSTLGTMGATAAIARLARLSAAETANALGIASSLSSGLRVNFGTMTKPLHAGLAAKNGIFATLFAQRGFTAAEDGIGARFGFLDVFCGKEEPRPEELDPAQFGRPWEITLPYGLAIKQFPSCGATHPAIEAALALRDQHGLSAADIRSVRVGTGKLSSRILIYSEPRTGLEGKFSMEYCVSAALRHGWIGLEHFDDAAVDDPSVRRLMRLTEVYENDEVADSTEFAVVIEVELTDGQKYSHRVDLAKGKVARPMSERELHTKFRDCATRATTTQRVEALLSVLVGLRAVPDVRQITQLLEA